MDTPDELRYSSDHEWVRIENSLAHIGITDFAQDALGDVVYVELPEVGLSVSANSAFAEIESTKSVSDVFAPISGEVVGINDALEDRPELVNEDPYGEGWICVIKPSEESEFDQLMDAQSYEAFVLQESQGE
ncbi:MAG TPA: glycine cleavage system protein GcvH [Acidimicrobiaceae bacterium]|nr:glycine cleavage system protein GcvH [Acidimicrobiaceae bacterium]|tara:strand:+ start:30 stop:425 length:396 start_codon:yes stop_codon:yes gene_type:complete